MSVRTVWNDTKCILLIIFAIFIFLHIFPFRGLLVRSLFTVPLFGALVRFRVNFTPKHDALRDGGSDMEAGNQGTRTEGEEVAVSEGEGEGKVRNYFDMLRRVYNQEVRQYQLCVLRSRCSAYSHSSVC